MKSSGAEDQAPESVDSAGVTIKTNKSAESVPTDVWGTPRAMQTQRVTRTRDLKKLQS
ncbi:hypothetical protein PF007_g31913 [Phytophthora fragariae]|nr:hypothetical protein PF007_g31913 [Phytophthora fragariae]KAE9262818.1 hypothetical protein PF008_g32506 [Phytophthora fragariae]